MEFLLTLQGIFNELLILSMIQWHLKVNQNPDAFSNKAVLNQVMNMRSKIFKIKKILFQSYLLSISSKVNIIKSKQLNIFIYVLFGFLRTF